MERFVDDYSDSYAKKHVGQSTAQIEQIIRETPAEELAVALGTRFDEWEERRPDKIGARNAVQAGAAFASETWALLGVPFLVWRTVGPSCPLCRKMEGRRITIGGAFLEKGDTVDPEDDGVTAVLQAKRTIPHPPLHGDGCDCMVVAGR